MKINYYLLVFIEILLLLFTGTLSIDLNFINAQCRAKCSRYYYILKNNSIPELPSDPETKGVLSEDDHLKCFTDAKQACNEKCFDGCRIKLQGDFSVDEKLCRFTCKNSHCLLGCYLMSQTLKGGTNFCPSIGHSDISRSNCFKSCQTDNDCPYSLDKCCSAGCPSLTCVKSVYNQSIPPTPDNLTLEEENGGLSISWNEPFADLIKEQGILTFVIEMRFGLCPNRMTSDWRRLITLNTLGVFLDKFIDPHSYQFRVAAVSAQGTRGFGRPSKIYTPSKMVMEPPTRPRNLTDVRWRIYASGRISVILTWQKPLKSSFPVDHYQIRWVVDHGYVQPNGQSLESLTYYTKKISADNHMFTLSNLDPVTKYKVQVRAISIDCQRQKLTSKPNTLFISTMSITSKSKQDDIGSLSGNSCICKNAKFITPTIETTPPLYSRNNLTYTIKLHSRDVVYMVEWVPRVCIESSRGQAVRKQKLKDILHITGLDFNCRYSLKLIPIESSTSKFHPHQQPSVIKSCFCTPSCAEVDVEYGSRPPICAHKSVSLPSPPETISSKLEDPVNLIYRISWSAATLTDDKTDTNSNQYRPYTDRELRYRIVWAPREEEPVNKEMYNDEAGFSPIIDFRNSDVRVVKGNTMSLRLKNLKRATFYIVRVQTLISINGEDIESSPAVYYFTTMGFQNPSQSKESIISKFIRNSSSRSLCMDCRLLSIILSIIIVRLYL